MLEIETGPGSPSVVTTAAATTTAGPASTMGPGGGTGVWSGPSGSVGMSRVFGNSQTMTIPADATAYYQCSYD